MSRGSAGSKPAAAAATEPLAVAYHDGPPEISFAGRIWRRGDAQAVTGDEWAAMRARADCAHFDFRPAMPAAPVPTEE